MHPHAWTWKPDVAAMALLALSGAFYAAGLARMWRRGGRPPGLEITAFTIGWLTLAAALLSPIATFSEWLFSVHMTQHELLMLVAAPLIAIGRPLVPMLWALPRRWRTASRASAAAAGLAVLASPPVAFLLHAVALWGWHLPVLYEAAVLDERIHLVQHICFAGTAAIFWWGLIRGRYGRFGYGAAVIYVFATALHSGGLGALLAFSTRPWYEVYAQRSATLEAAVADQQLGGLIMWIPAGVVMMLFALALFAAWLGEAERRRQRGWL
ncbi:MAG TPA: cytochrome c oxidase assembly protein [Vicinamibacterales bacterium]|nr:cytochrome c oxidase assembly protein [Vicinamibacterales bacterium]